MSLVCCSDCHWLPKKRDNADVFKRLIRMSRDEEVMHVCRGNCIAPNTQKPPAKGEEEGKRLPEEEEGLQGVRKQPLAASNTRKPGDCRKLSERRAVTWCVQAATPQQTPDISESCKQLSSDCHSRRLAP
jgi:hypothetical protein